MSAQRTEGDVFPWELRRAYEQDIAELENRVECLKAHLTAATRVCVEARHFLAAANQGMGRTGEQLRKALKTWEEQTHG